MIRLMVIALVMAVQPELVDRTLALVGGQPITLSDARAAVAFGLVRADPPPDAAAGLTALLALLVERELVLREVRRYAPPAPADAAVDAGYDELRRRFADTAAFNRALDVHGVSEVRLRAWLRDDLRTVAYLAQDRKSVV